jgi:hypothetical protein
MTSALAVTRPATKPPPGALCPRRKTYTDTTSAKGSSQRAAIENTSGNRCGSHACPSGSVAGRRARTPAISAATPSAAIASTVISP